MLVVKQVEFYYPPQFHFSTDFQVNDQERLAIFAKSGKGKSTLLQWMVGLIRAQKGELWIHQIQNGKSIEKNVTLLPPEKRNFGYMPQDYGLFESWSVEKNMAYPLLLRKIDAQTIRQKIKETAEILQIQHKLKDLAGALSGGEKQRVSLARALIFNPDAVLLDEPFSALDLENRHSAREWVLSVTQKLKVPLLFVTHDEEDVKILSTRVLNL